MAVYKIKETITMTMPLGFKLVEERMLPYIYTDFVKCGDDTMKLILKDICKGGSEVHRKYEMIIEEENDD